MIICTGYYHRSNLGDDIFYYLFKSILNDICKNIKYKLVSLDDLKILPVDTQIIILGGGEILNSYFLQKLEKLCENFRGKIIAYSCELPQGDLIPQINIIDYFVVRNKNDQIKLSKHFNLNTDNKYIFYYPDLVTSLSIKTCKEDKITLPKINKITFCLARSIYPNNNNYQNYLNQTVKFIEYLTTNNYIVNLFPFNSSLCNNESDLFLNNDIFNLCIQSKINVNNIIPNFTWNEEDKINNCIEVFNDSDLIICSRYHAHIMSLITKKPFISISHTKKTFDLVNEFKLDKYMIRPEMDSTNKPINLDYKLLINKFVEIKKDYLDVINTINQHKFPNLNDHKNKLLKLLVSNYREIPPFYVSDFFINKLLEDIQKDIQNIFQINNFKIIQNLKIKELISRFILYQVCNNPDEVYLYGLVGKIFNSDFNFNDEIRWICRDYYSKNPKNISFDNELSEFPNKNRIFNLKYIQPHLLSNIHRSGWFDTVHKTSILHNNNGIIFDMFVDRTFHWCNDLFSSIKLVPYEKPWIGIVHHTPNTEYTDYNTNTMIKKESWRKSLKNCVGIYTLSEWLGDWFKSKYPDLLVESLIHPTDIPNKLFDYNKFLENSEKKIIQIGSWLRNPYSIYALKITNNFKKIHLIGKNMENYIKPNKDFSELINIKLIENKPLSISRDNSSNKYVYFMNEYIKTINDKDNIIKILENNHNSVQLLYNINNNDYDEILTNNIVFIDLIEASACNTLLECIVRNTPILTRPLPAVIERLGKDYPMYYQSLDEIPNLITNQNIYKTTMYLKSLNKSCYTFDYWINSIINSQIFKKAQYIVYPKLLEQAILDNNQKIDCKINKKKKKKRCIIA
jgi:hypothetical protein